MADFTITMNNPEYVDGQEFIVVGFPAELKNGETSTVTPEQIADYEAFTGSDFTAVADGITGAETSGDTGTAADSGEPTQTSTRRATKKGGE